MEDYKGQNGFEDLNAIQVDIPNNYFKGFLGACIGGIVGAIITVVLYYIGIVSAFSAWIAIAIGAALYKKFGGKENKVMALIVGSTSVLFCLLAVFGIYLYYANLYMLVYDLPLQLNIFEKFNICMKIVDGFKADFIKDMLMNLAFSILGVIFVVSNIIKQAKVTEEAMKK